MDVSITKMTILTVLGAVGGFLTNLFGGWGEDMITLLIFMGTDFLLGVLIAAFWQKSDKSRTGAVSSYSAWKGLVKKGVTLLIVLVAHRLDITLGTEYIRPAVIIAFCANELISIIENLGIMGVPLPTVLTRAMELLQNKTNTKGNGK